MDDRGRKRAVAIAVASLGLILIVAMLGAGHAAAADGDGGGAATGEDETESEDPGEVDDVELVTEDKIGFEGQLQARVGEQAGAGLLARWSDPGAVELEAERLRVRTEVAKGERVSMPSGDEVWHQGAHDRGTRTFEGVEARLKAWQPSALVLAEPSDDARARVGARGEQAMGVIEERTLAWLGSRGGGSEGEGQLPTYEHRIEEPTVLLEGRGRGEVAGAFTVFTDGATMSIAQAEDGEEVWRNWTGIRWEQTAPRVEEYELRITLLEVEGARLSVGQTVKENASGSASGDGDAAAGAGPQGAADVNLLGGEMAVESEGQIQADRVDGLVEAGDGETYLLDEAAVVLSGEASGIARRSRAPSVGGGGGQGGQGSQGGQSSPEEPSPPLAFAAEGDLSMLAGEAERLTRLSTSDEEGGLGLVAALAPLALAAVAGVVAVRQPMMLRPLPDRWTDRLYRRWENEGLARESEGDCGAAARLYRRLVRLRPGQPMGWFLLARARLDGGEPHEAIAVLRQGRHRASKIPLDLLELQAEAWGMLGVQAAAVAVLEAIAEEDAGYAASIAERLAEEGDIAGEDAHRLRLGAEEGEGTEGCRHLAGYA